MVISFAGTSDVLSNLYSSEMKVFDTVHKSSEHAYQNDKAIHGGDIPRAQEIQSAHLIFGAKQIGKRISSSANFESKKEELETDIIEAKLRPSIVISSNRHSTRINKNLLDI